MTLFKAELQLPKTLYVGHTIVLIIDFKPDIPGFGNGGFPS